MGYSSTGVYTGPSGSTDTVPGQVIRSATWNTINTSYAAALTQVGQQMFNGPATVTSGPYTVAATIASLIFNGGGTITVVMPAASATPGYLFTFKTVAAQAVVASASVVAPLSSTSPGTAILAATVGKFCRLQSDGANWVVMMAN